MDPRLRELLACPHDHGDLTDVPDVPGGAPVELVCVTCGLAYPVVDDVAVLLVDEARATRP